MAYKPEGYNSLSAYLIVDGAKRMRDLLKSIFEAEELRKYEREDGTLMHLEMRLDDTVLMVSDSTDAYPANKTVLHVYVSDVFQTFQRALDNGCTPVEAPIQKGGDTDVRGAFIDFAGNFWSVATQGGEA